MDKSRFEEVSRTLSWKVREIALAKLYEHGFLGVDARADAPSSYEDLLDAYRQGGELFPVWSGASEHSIYDSAGINWLARAWHDLMHIELRASFSVVGDIAVGEAQASHPRLDEVEREFIWYDVVGQAIYESDIGHFPVDQRAFCIACLEAGRIVFEEF